MLLHGFSFLLPETLNPATAISLWTDQAVPRAESKCIRSRVLFQILPRLTVSSCDLQTETLNPVILLTIAKPEELYPCNNQEVKVLLILITAQRMPAVYLGWE